MISLFSTALACLKERPGSAHLIQPGIYHISTPPARSAQRKVMNGTFGRNPEPVMFSPEYRYARGIDSAGFMEPVSIRNCSGITVRGLTIDHLRQPYGKGVVTALNRYSENHYAPQRTIDKPLRQCYTIFA